MRDPRFFVFVTLPYFAFCLLVSLVSVTGFMKGVGLSPAASWFAGAALGLALFAAPKLLDKDSERVPEAA